MFQKNPSVIIDHYILDKSISALISYEREFQHMHMLYSTGKYSDEQEVKGKIQPCALTFNLTTPMTHNHFLKISIITSNGSHTMPNFSNYDSL